MTREIKFRGWFSDIGMKYDIYDIRTNCILMQYTGLNDKNGKNIYESDILKVGEYLDIVDWGSGCFCMRNQMYSYEFTYQNEKDITVIGNIYENPELLIKQ